MFRTESVRAADLRKGQSFITPTDSPGFRPEVAGRVALVTEFESLSLTVRLTYRLDHDGNTFSQEVVFEADRPLTRVCLSAGMEMAYEAFRNAAAEAGIV